MLATFLTAVVIDSKSKEFNFNNPGYSFEIIVGFVNQCLTRRIRNSDYTKQLSKISLWKNRWFVKDDGDDTFTENNKIDMAKRIQVKVSHIYYVISYNL